MRISVPGNGLVTTTLATAVFVAVARETGRGENPMYQPALPVQHPHIALGEKLGAHEPSKARMFVRAFVGHVLRLLRLLGQFAAAGGPLS
jgi:hypothetical protein